MSNPAPNRPMLWLMPVLLALLASCGRQSGRAKINWGISLDHNSKNPYGTSIAYETLPHYFPAARREPLTRWFRYTGVDEQMDGRFDSAALLVMLGLDYYVTGEEWLHILKFARAGNEVFILSSKLDHMVARTLGCEPASGGLEDYPLRAYYDGSQAAGALKLYPDTAASFGYYGRWIGAYYNLRSPAHPDSLVRMGEDESGESTDEPFSARHLYSSIDTPATILGKTVNGPDFIRYRVGHGHVTLHAAPLVLSNYFLLQPGNRSYLDAVWHAFPANISVVYWNEYYRRTTEQSNMSVLLKYPATRWALIIGAFTLLLYVLFGLKRLQRIVPVVQPHENASVSFVETVGRLYFNKGDHANIAEKMVQHFLEWVRTNYYLDTSQLNAAFIRQLAAKSGKSEPEVEALINSIHDLRLRNVVITPEYLHGLYRSIQSFYKTR